MTYNERLTELEEKIFHLCRCIEILGRDFPTASEVVADARKLAECPSDQWQKSWQQEEEESNQSCCDLCEADGHGACRGDASDNDYIEEGYDGCLPEREE